MKKLRANELKNMHLTSKKFHEIASNHVPRKLKLNFMFVHLLETVPVPIRIYDELEISDQLLQQEHMNMILTIVQRTGVHVKKLHLRQGDQNVSKPALIRILNSCPNLQDLSLGSLHISDTESFQGKIACPKLKILNISNCESEFEDFLLNSLENDKFKLNEFCLSSYTILKFLPLLKSQEKSIKKLKVELQDEPGDFLQIIAALPEMKLEYFECFDDFSYSLETNDERFLEFLRRQPNLKCLKLRNTLLRDAALDVIGNTINKLEILELANSQWYDPHDLSSKGTENLGKLKNLNKLAFTHRHLSFNNLNGLTVAVNENLRELEADFYNTTIDFVLELPRFLPNLKKLSIKRGFNHKLDLLKIFPKLECVEAEDEWDLYDFFPSLSEEHSQQFASNLKLLKIGRIWPLTKENARELSMSFPKLEHLSFEQPRGLTDDSVEILLKEFKHLKCLHILRNDRNQLTEKTVSNIKNFGQHLEQFHIWSITTVPEFVRKELIAFGELLLVSHNTEVAITRFHSNHKRFTM